MEKLQGFTDHVMFYVKTLVKWLLAAALIGTVGGVVGSLFHLGVEYATELRTEVPALLYALPLAGVLIVALYRFLRTQGVGTNAVLDAVHQGRELPILLIPAIFLATLLTHLAGGSAGREGAADGAGLGHDFLRHIDRCRLLVHVVDVSGSEGRDPVADFDAINAELAQYSPELATRPQIVVANKTDIMEDEALLEKLRAHVEEAGYPLFALSAASHTGTRELVLKIAEKLSTLPPVTVYEPEYVPRPPKLDTSAPLNITVDDNTYIVEGPWLERLMANVNFSDYESRMYFDKMLRESGLFARLEEMGIQDGDIVSLYNLEFEYQH